MHPLGGLAGQFWVGSRLEHAVKWHCLLQEVPHFHTAVARASATHQQHITVFPIQEANLGYVHLKNTKQSKRSDTFRGKIPIRCLDKVTVNCFFSILYDHFVCIRSGY